MLGGPAWSLRDFYTEGGLLPLLRHHEELLSIVTLGIFSAWAKVRNKQYFYRNTLVDGSSFEYLASPIAILKGRIIAAVALAAFFAAQQYSLTLYVILAVVFLAVR